MICVLLLMALSLAARRRPAMGMGMSMKGMKGMGMKSMKNKLVGMTEDEKWDLDAEDCDTKKLLKKFKRIKINNQPLTIASFLKFATREALYAKISPRRARKYLDCYIETPAERVHL